MRKRLAAVLAAAAVGTAACGSATAGSSPDVPRPVESSVAMAPAATRLDYSTLAGGIRAFGYAVAQAEAPDAGPGNLVFSPASLEIAFSMLREGARGATARSLDKVMHLPADRQAAYNGLIHALRDPGPGNVVDVGNGLFLARDYPLEPSYLTALKKWYGAGVYKTRFPDPALDDINAYVDAHTHGRIANLLQPGDLNPGDVFALVNTVYLNARWEHPFNRYATETLPFHITGTSTVQVQNMESRGDAQLAVAPHWDALRLPYRGDRLSMEILLPNDRTNPLRLLSPRALAYADKRMATYGDVGVELPRWNMQSRFDNMTDVLEGLGMTHVFDGSGDFTGITPDPTFSVERVVHEANITVGERGTVAAAATGIIGAQAVSAAAPPPVTFYADHPFAYVIFDNTTGTPLFEGVVSDPS